MSNEVKNIAQLTIGDILYKVWTDYNAKEKPTFGKIVVRNIRKTDTDLLVINVNENYPHNSEFVFPLNECNVPTVKNKDIGYYTTDERELYRLLGDAALYWIGRYQNDIKEIEAKIRNIREAYYEYLNPSSHEK